MLKEDFSQILKSKVKWDRFSGKTVLITGASGLLASYMVETLLLLNKSTLQENNCKVIAIVRNLTTAKERFSNYSSDKNLKIIAQDVSQVFIINEPIDFIIHAASSASPKHYGTDPVGVIMPNVLGTKNTLDLSIQHNVSSYLYFSSSEIYGKISNGEILHENNYGYLDPLNIRSCYGESKRMGENICISYYHQFSVPIKIVRPTHTYGPGIKLNDGRVFSDFVKNILSDENIELKSDGFATRSFCYIADATIAFFMILLSGKNGEAYNVSNPGQTVSIKALAEILVSIYPDKKLEVLYSSHEKSYIPTQAVIPVADITKIKNLGWQPTIDIRDGFSRTISSFNKP